MSLRPGAVNFEEKWRGLEVTISAVVTLSPVSHTTWNDQYSDIYALCEAFPTSYADTLYKETQILLQNFVAGLLESLQCQEAVSLVSSYQHHWLCYQQGAKYLDNLFSYYNRVPLRKYQPHHDVMPCHVIGIATPLGTAPKDADSPIQIRHMALKVWKDGLLEPLRQQLVAALLEDIRRDRDGESADLGVVRDVVGSFIEVEESKADESLRYYQDSFETPFLSETGHYYRLAASGMVTELSCSEYIRQVVLQLQTARRAGMRFLHPTSLTKFVRECESRLVVDYKDAYIYTHTRDMVRQENAADLSNLFLLFTNIPKALQPVVTEFEEHVKEKGTLSLRQLYQDRGYGVAEFVSAILSVHSHYHSMVNTLFNAHKDFSAALDRACRAFVNIPERPRQQPRAPLLLARYCDQLLRKSSKGSAAGNEGEVEERLQDAITVFRYVEDKDMFQRFYSRMLSRRLVQALSLSMEAEETMIYKLKHACGYEYTARLQRMVVDIRLSTDAMTAFQESLAAEGESLPISFSTMVLQSAAWPLQKSTCSVSIPPNLQLAKSKFEGFYMSKHNGRTLSWLHHLSLCELRLTYLKRSYTVSVSTYQMAVLLAYNHADSLTFSSLSQLTQLPSHELSSTLLSLTDSKILLQQGSKGQGGGAERSRGQEAEAGEEKFLPDSLFQLNMSYSNKRTKFKITAMLQKDSQQEIEQTLYNVTEDRKLHIQAAIVRVMKARKLLQHNQLIQEAISQVRSRFTPNVQMIKRCIETLMEKQYLERQEEARDTYAYVA